YARFQNEMVIAGDAIIICESGDEPPLELAGRSIHPVAFPAKSKNVMAIAMLASLFGLPLEGTRNAVAQRFAKKKQAVIDANLQAFDSGLAEAEKISVAKRLVYERS